MTTATARADLSAIKARQQKTWASGDYAVVAARIVLASELLADAADDDGRAALAADLAHLARHWDRNHGGSIAIPATYLETVLTLR